MITPTYTAEFCVFSREIHARVSSRRVSHTDQTKRSNLEARAQAESEKQNKPPARARVAVSLSLSLSIIRTDMNVL